MRGLKKLDSSTRVYLCENGECLLNEDTYRIYAPCMYQPSFEKYKEKMEGYITDSSVKIFVCEYHGDHVGFLVLKDDEILGIAVDENCRKLGLGKLMINEAMRSLDLKCVRAQTDDDAVDFYRRCGFKIERREVEYPDGVAVRYDCFLGKESLEKTNFSFAINP